MTALDKKFRKLATNLIDKYGKSVTLTSVTNGAYNPATGTSAKTTATSTVKAIVEDYSLHSSGVRFQTGLIKAGDKKVTIAALGIITKPKPSDTITIDTVAWNIVRVVETWSGEQIAVYECQLRV